MRFMIVLMALALTACGSRMPMNFGNSKGEAVIEPKKPEGEAVQKERIRGVVEMVDEPAIDIGKIDRPLILIFATRTCFTCMEEATHMAEYFQAKAGLPTNVTIITILAGYGIDVARRWKTNQNITWHMGYDPDATFFAGLCPERVTPCVFTQNLSASQSLRRHIGKKSLADLETETGPWTFGGYTP